MGDTKGGPFEIDETTAQTLLASLNPDGRDNADVVRAWVNGLDLTRRPRRMWIIDFGVDMPIEEAALFEAPFEYVKRRVEPVREASKSTISAWWLHERPRVEMRRALAGLSRYLLTPRVSKHRIFVWVHAETLPDSAVIAIARDDDYTFGVLHSRAHQLWALAQGTQLETRPRYTPTTTFETFPFPHATPEAMKVIGDTAADLDRLRTGWLDPTGASPEELENRTLTKLYNQMPTWLQQAHQRLDRAVLDTYSFPSDLSDDDLLSRLLDLNLGREAV